MRGGAGGGNFRFQVPWGTLVGAPKDMVLIVAENRN